jgi:uncharacterized protein HemX
MENPSGGAGHGRDGKPQSGPLMLSMSANVVLVALAIGLGIWGYTRHERAKELAKLVADADQKTADAIQERDEAWENSRELQSRLVNAKGLMNAINPEPVQPRRRNTDDDDTSPP